MEVLRVKISIEQNLTAKGKNDFSNALKEDLTTS